MMCGVVSLLSAFSFLLGFSGPEDGAPIQSLADLKHAVREVMAARDVPGLAIALVDETGPIWVEGMGLADVESGRSVDEHSMFRIGSTSKMFVALAVLDLVEQGRLALDDRLADRAPDVAFENRWESTDPVRIVHLLEHTTGWDDLHLPEYAHNDPSPCTLKQGLDFHPHSRICRWKPGSRMAYCNSGPAVAARVVEQITGMRFEDYVQKRFFDAMGMESMTYFLDEAVAQKGVTLYQDGEPQEYWHILMRPAGSINACALDMARFLTFFIQRGQVQGEPLIRRESLNRMQTPHTTNAAKMGMKAGYALHNYASIHENWVYREHNGGVNGGVTRFAYLPEARCGHAIMLNCADGEAFREITELVRNFETRDLPTPPILAQWELTDAHRQLAGVYHPINPRQDMAFFLEYLLGKQRVWVEQGEVRVCALLGGEARAFLPVNERMLKHKQTGITAMASCTDPLAGEVLHVFDDCLQRESALWTWTQYGVLGLWLLLSATALIWSPFWIIRRCMGRVTGFWAIQMRLWPLIGVLCAIVFVALAAVGMDDPFQVLSRPTLISVGMMGCTLLFAVSSIASLWAVGSARGKKVNRWAYAHCLLLTLAETAVVAYLLCFGVIGLRTWS